MQASVVHCLKGSCNRILGEHTLLTCKGLVHTILDGIEILYLGGNMNRQHRSIILCNGLYSAYAVLEIIPECRDIVSDWGNNAQTCNYYSLFFHFK